MTLVDRIAGVTAASPDDSATFPLTDSGNAEFFELDADHRLAFDHTAQRWFEFDGHHWRPDTLQHVMERALASVRQRTREAANLPDADARKAGLRHGLRSEEHRRLVDLLKLAQGKRTIAVDGSNWDQHPLLFGVQNGVVDLETGRARAGHTFDYITKVSPVVYDPAAQCPRFLRFLRELFPDQPDVIGYLQRVFGYWLTGLTDEQAFWIFYGLGANGKSTLMEVLLRLVWGIVAYGWVMPFPTAAWTTTMSEYQRAELPGRRLVTASEVRQRGHLHEDFIKSLTGGDAVNARRPFGRPFTFVPVAKFVLRCNERPIIRDLTHSMWRRVKLIPFTQTFAVDATLMPALVLERDGIFNWLLEGLHLWRREGLCEPGVVQTATAEYREASDILTEFFQERCVIADGLSVGGRELYAAFQHWSEVRRLEPEDRLSQTRFGLRVKDQFPDIGTPRKTRYSGLALRESVDQEER